MGRKRTNDRIHIYNVLIIANATRIAWYQYVECTACNQICMYWSVGNKKFYKHKTKHTRKKLINFIFFDVHAKTYAKGKTCRQTIYILNTRFTTSAILINVVINYCLSIFGCFMEILVEIYEKANMLAIFFFRANFLLNDRWSLNFCLQRTFNRLIIFFFLHPVFWCWL